MEHQNFTPKSIKKHLTEISPSSPFPVPDTPTTARLGYGTGVNVYRMNRNDSNSPWALKKLARKSIRGNVVSRLFKESLILKHLNHPNIIGYRGYSQTTDGRPVLAMEEGGQSLGDIIESRAEKNNGPFPPELILKIVYEACKALNYLHNEKKLIHGDIKSYNILTKENFKVIKLCDFGVSYELVNGKAENYIGTECWSAPETLYGGTVTDKADMFALGMTIFEMLALEAPHFQSNSSLLDISDISEYEDTYGTRPVLPAGLGEEYSKVIEIFNWCTEEELNSRASATDILSLIEKNLTL